MKRVWKEKQDVKWLFFFFSSLDYSLTLNIILKKQSRTEQFTRSEKNSGSYIDGEWRAVQIQHCNKTKQNKMIHMSRYLLCSIVKLCTFDFTTVLLFNSVYLMAMMAAFGSIHVCYCVLVSEKEREKCNQSISQIHHVYECLLKDRPNEPVYTYSFIIIHVRNATVLTVTLCFCWFLKANLIINWFIYQSL